MPLPACVDGGADLKGNFPAVCRSAGCAVVSSFRHQFFATSASHFPEFAPSHSKPADFPLRPWFLQDRPPQVHPHIFLLRIGGVFKGWGYMRSAKTTRLVASNTRAILATFHSHRAPLQLPFIFTPGCPSDPLFLQSFVVSPGRPCGAGFFLTSYLQSGLWIALISGKTETAGPSLQSGYPRVSQRVVG
jgi:hypothetical protein